MVVFLGPNREVPLRLCRDRPGALWDKDKTTSDFKVKLSAVTLFANGPWICYDIFSKGKESWEMEFVHWHGISGTFWWFIRNQRKDFKMMICCHKVIVFFPQWDSLKIQSVNGKRQAEEPLCCVFGLSHFCKCLNVSVKKKGALQQWALTGGLTFLNISLPLNCFRLRCCLCTLNWPADKPEIRSVTGFLEWANVLSGVKMQAFYGLSSS